MGILRILLWPGKKLIYSLLYIHRFRQRLIFEIVQKYYKDLDIRVPLGYGFVCPISSREAWLSFSQIFFESEYEPIFSYIGFPQRWLDLGSHMGYFSLYTIWMKAKLGLESPNQALLIDADSRLKPGVEKLIQINGLEDSLEFLQGLISRSEGEHQFVERAYMESASAEYNSHSGKHKSVKSISAQEILESFPPPYDLVKIDIEGGEYDFFVNYQSVLQHTQHIVMEWHSWHAGGGGRDQMKMLANENGFIHIHDIIDTHLVPFANGRHYCGVFLCSRSSNR